MPSSKAARRGAGGHTFCAAIPSAAAPSYAGCWVFPAYLKDPDDSLHYTDTAGLLGILHEEPKLWASDVRFMNDAQELLYAQDAVVDGIKTMSSPTLREDHWAHELGNRAVQTFEKYKGFVLDNVAAGNLGVYVVCFCESGDLLSQWRGYGKNEGYVIEFRADSLQEGHRAIGAYPEATGLFPVGYGEEAVSDGVARTIAAVELFNLNHPGVKASYKALTVAAILATIKHPGFSEEREWRLITAFQDNEGEEFGLHSNPTKFRPSNVGLSPYVELSVPMDAVVSVRVGPGDRAEIREAAVRRLLKSVKSKAAVLPSTIPFRG